MASITPPQATKEVFQLQYLVDQFAAMQYTDKTIASTMLKLLSETANRLAQDAGTFEAEAS